MAAGYVGSGRHDLLLNSRVTAPPCGVRPILADRPQGKHGAGHSFFSAKLSTQFPPSTAWGGQGQGGGRDNTFLLSKLAYSTL